MSTPFLNRIATSPILVQRDVHLLGPMQIRVLSRAELKAFQAAWADANSEEANGQELLKLLAAAVYFEDAPAFDPADLDAFEQLSNLQIKGLIDATLSVNGIGGDNATKAVETEKKE